MRFLGKWIIAAAFAVFILLTDADVALAYDTPGDLQDVAGDGGGQPLTSVNQVVSPQNRKMNLGGTIGICKPNENRPLKCVYPNSRPGLLYKRWASLYGNANVRADLICRKARDGQTTQCNDSFKNYLAILVTANPIGTADASGGLKYAFFGKRLAAK